MNNKVNEVAAADAHSIKGTSIGYAINLIMDYGSGRQITISGTLPLGASLKDMNAELDKLRLATNRQSSLVNMRDVQNSVAMAKKSIAGLKLALETYDIEMEKEIERLKGGEKSNHTQTKQQIENMRSQAVNHKLTKGDEILRLQTDVEKGELMLAEIKKEIDLISEG